MIKRVLNSDIKCYSIGAFASSLVPLTSRTLYTHLVSIRFKFPYRYFILKAIITCFIQSELAQLIFQCPCAQFAFDYTL